MHVGYPESAQQDRWVSIRADSAFYGSDYDAFGGAILTEVSAATTLERVTLRNLKVGADAFGPALMRNCTFADNQLDVELSRQSALYTDMDTTNFSVEANKFNYSPHLTNQEARARVKPLSQAPLDKFLQADDAAFVKLRKVLTVPPPACRYADGTGGGVCR